MASIEKNALITAAQQAYDECEKFIVGTAEVLARNAENTKDAELLPKISMETFDIILQACLLNSAVSDGQLEEEEIEFIRKVTKHADLLESEVYGFQIKGKKFTWEDYAKLSTEDQQQVGLEITAVLKEAVTAFVKLFATVDKVLTEVDFLELLLERAVFIFVALAGVDGDDYESEIVKAETAWAGATFKVLLMDTWREVTGE